MDSPCDVVEKCEKSQENHRKIRQILEELSQSQVLLKDEVSIKEYYNKLAEVYCVDGFRHLYSEIFGYLTFIDNDEKMSLEILNQNINTIYEHCSSGYIKDDKNCFPKIEELYDHINLDISRINSTRDVIGRHSELNLTIGRVKNDIKETEAKVKLIDERTDKIQREYITILGVFASIVLAFVTGVSFSTSVLANIDKVPIVGLFFIVLLIGIVLTNLLYLLMTFIAHINSSYECLSTKYIKYVNVALIVFLVISFFVLIRNE